MRFISVVASNLFIFPQTFPACRSASVPTAPSQLMDEMLALLGDHKPCMLFESLFLMCMPDDIRLQLDVSTSLSDIRTLAECADTLWQAREQTEVLSFTSNITDENHVEGRPPRDHVGVTNEMYTKCKCRNTVFSLAKPASNPPFRPPPC